MEMAVVHEEDIVIVGAGIAGLTTALALHRLGVASVVLESSDRLRVTGLALTLWANAWRALDAVGIGHFLKQKSHQILGFKIASQDPSLPTAEADPNFRKLEARCVRRKDLLEALQRELPHGMVRYSSKVVLIKSCGKFKLIHLADGSIIKAKVLIGCDGVNSKVASWLGLRSPVSTEISAIRGFVEYPDGHAFEPRFHGYFRRGLRCDVIPCHDRSIYWSCTFRQSIYKYDENDQSPMKMKQFVLTNILNAPKQILDVVERTEPECISYAPLRHRSPWNVLLGNIVKDNVCVAGDALHPMLPFIGQGGCSALEDGVVLSRCLVEALLEKPGASRKGRDVHARIKNGLKRYSLERRWRSFELIWTSQMVGLIHESDGRVMRCLREKFLHRFSVRAMVKMVEFDCGKLVRV